MSQDISQSFMAPVVAKQAACTTVDPEIFFPNMASQSYGDFGIRQAKKVCARCPIVFECLEFAFHTGDKWAILGGKTPSEREAMRRRRNTTTSELKAA